jgi:serum/glucocorticoid-regulated kinase 2
MLVKKKGESANTLYALKTLRKAALIKRNQLAHTSTERTILQNINCPFLVHLVFAFQTVDKLYMVLDYMGGGELFFWLKKDRLFTESRVKLYTAEIMLALEALHDADIIYRDLKPENILLDAKGHLRLTDFGLSKSGITGAGAEGGTKTFCGTPEYLSPEILENKGHGKGADWWALGTLVFEMLTGLPPYYDTNVQRMYHKILHEPLRFPKGDRLALSENATNLLRGMLERKVPNRLGCGPGGTAEMKVAPFFKPLDMARVTNKEYTPEFKPPASTSQTDVRNFDTEFTNEQAADSLVVSRMTETMQEKSNFEGFTYGNNDNRLKSSF